ncbi:phospholipid-transporting ATPase, partial [Paragonimus westermani]
QIPGVSPTGRFTTAVPLAIILTVSAIKEMIEDLVGLLFIISIQQKRHYADDKTNNSKTLVLRNGEWVETVWKELQGLPQTGGLLTAGALSSFHGWVECQLPNRKLDEFVGALRAPDSIRYPLKPNQLLLRGASLKNTKWIFGLAIYTGKETKVMLNSTAPPLKQSTVERQTNTYILFLFGVLLFLTVFTFAANLIWTRYYEVDMWYLDRKAAGEPTLRTVLDFITYLILYNTVIPISLSVMLEVVRFTQALYINRDLDMYDPDTDTPAMARTSNLNEELGQVRYLFSDKTGTLTRNVMEFKRCSIGGVMYGNDTADSNALSDGALLARLKMGDPLARHFFIVLAVCHTVVPECNAEQPDQPLNYQASSPDEAALVKAARALGFVFTTRTPTGVSIEVNGEELHYEVLQVLEFTSVRKRMGVVVREPSGRILVMVKGADTVVFERLAKTSRFREATMHHLEVFAKTGLRTLCIASAEVSSAFHANWTEQYYVASTAIDNREEKLEAVAELIEGNLQLLGATAIEDKLQHGVSETISNLLRAGISIWVLTGDKQETAINIGYSCRLLNQDLELVTLNTETLDQTRTQLCDLVEDFGDNLRAENAVALIVDGHTFGQPEQYSSPITLRGQRCSVWRDCFMGTCVGVQLQILATEAKLPFSAFRDSLAKKVSPWQKGEIVKLVRASLKNAVTLAIGDGANDVGMIQAAHVGVGISGMEGMQAACASDYAIAQFRFLNKLLLVHGAWNYNRLTKLILYSFYKNVCLYLIQFWFAILSGFSGQIVFERWTIGLYNVLFSAAPPLALGLFDRSCSVNNCLKYPELYRDTQASASFNLKVFLCWVLNSVFHSAVLFWIPLAAFHTSKFPPFCDIHINNPTTDL